MIYHFILYVVLYHVKMFIICFVQKTNLISVGKKNKIWVHAW